MVLGQHKVECIAFPGDREGYLHKKKSKPGDVVGFFSPMAQVYQCTQCGLQIQPVGDDNMSPVKLEEANRFRVPQGGLSRNLLETHSKWACKT